MQPVPGGVSLTATRRRRILYCVWWSAAPCRDPFRPPDAFGSAASQEEALAAAARAAGDKLPRPLPVLEGLWAGAYVRVREGKPPFVIRGPRRQRHRPGAARWDESAGCPFQVLGLSPGATALEVRRAFLALALRTHPDRGGEAAAFQRARLAYQTARLRAT